MPNGICRAPGCGKSIQAKGLCSQHYQRAWRGAPLEPTARKSCGHCGCVMPDPPYGQVSPEYCNRTCQGAASYARRKAAGTIRARARKDAVKAPCARCGEEFTLPRSDARFCSKPCARAWMRANETGECSEADCLRPVRAKGLCNKHYKGLLRSQGRLSGPPWSDARRDGWHRRRAIKKNASTGEPVILSEIAERDEWTCGLCHLPVLPELKWPDPLSKSLDHVQPLSLGGIHDPTNVQLAHLGCNSAKGNRVA